MPAPGEGLPIARVLIAEDDPDVRGLLLEYVETLGHDVLPVVGGQEVLPHVVASAPDLVLLDLGLPGLAGREVLAELRVLAPALPVVIMTGQNALELWAELVERGAFDVVTKPFNLQHLARVVREALAVRRRGP